MFLIQFFYCPRVKVLVESQLAAYLLNMNKASVLYIPPAIVQHAHTSFQHHLSLSHHALKLPFDPPSQQEIWLPQDPRLFMDIRSLAVLRSPSPSLKAVLISEEFSEERPHPHKSSYLM